MTADTICVVGLGYIGLPTATVLAGKGCRVIGLDVNAQVVDTVNRGEVHIVEPDLDAALRRAVRSGRLHATTTPPEADVFVIAVPTPFKEDRQPDLRFVEGAARAIAPRLRPGNLVILESTSPVGTTEALAGWLAAERPDLKLPGASEEADVFVAYCPERVLPGRVMRELVSNDRIIGGLTPRCSARAIDFYRLFVEGQCIAADARTAEMCKLAENSFRDTNIAFANELSVICDRLGIDVWRLIQLANRHPRVNILQPGPGVGGHCIAVDPWFIVSSAPEDARLIRAAREVNDAKPDWVVAKVEAAMRHEARPIACFGLAFKPDIDDLRESPAVTITAALADRFPGRVMAVEPHVDQLPAALRDKGVTLVSADLAIERAGVAVLLVDHRVFGHLAPRLTCTVIDTRGAWNRAPALAIASAA
jgi:UDP-N-acetyl-D-mannosaminuronic acid dehydrogenase